MASLHPLTVIFNKFVGKDVEFKNATVHNGERLISYKDFSSDKTIIDLQNAVEAHGMKLEVLFANSIRTDDTRTDRVRAELGKNPVNGKYCIDSLKIG